MRPFPSLLVVAASGLAACLFAAVVSIMPRQSSAESEHALTRSAPAVTPHEQEPAGYSRFDDTPFRLNENDEISALSSIQYALTELADGSSYIWHRDDGRLSGIVQPTTSFKDAAGKVCRHIIVILTSGERNRKTEAVACRLAGGRWQLDG
jgi:hypothetical protein